MAVVLWFTSLQVQHLCCGLVRFWSVYWQETLLHSGDLLQNPETVVGGDVCIRFDVYEMSEQGCKPAAVCKLFCLTTNLLVNVCFDNKT